MKFEVIKNSESFTGYDIEDKNYVGVIPGLCCGWQFEFEKDGKIDYNSVVFFEGNAEEYCDTWLRYGEDALFEIERMNGWVPTGRVIFRGYAESFWDDEERDWYVEEVDDISEYVRD